MKKKTRKWGRWEAVDASFDQGGQGQLYKVIDSKKEFPGQYVLKELKNPNRRERFNIEIRATASLPPHRNVVSLIDSGIFRNLNKPCYVMPEADMSLEAYLTSNSLSVDQKLKIFLAILRGVTHIHNGGIIHRDLKPENILMFGATPKIADLGLCLVADQPRNTPTNEAVGPRYYMAPELEDGKHLEVTLVADIYSLGKVLYFMLSGGKIFSREKQETPRWQLSKSLHDERYEIFRNLLGSSIAASPSNRYSSATDFADAVRKVRRNFADLPGTTIRAKIPNIADRLSAPAAQLSCLTTKEWSELLKLRRLGNAKFSADVIAAVKEALDPAIAGALAKEILAHRENFTKSALIEWARRIVLLDSHGSEIFDDLADFWNEVYELALASNDPKVCNIVADQSMFRSPCVLSALSRRYSTLSPERQENLLTAALIKPFEEREALLLAASDAPPTNDSLGIVVAGLMDVGSKQSIERVAQLLRKYSALDDVDHGLIQGIIMKGTTQSIAMLSQKSGYASEIKRMLKALLGLHEKASRVKSDDTDAENAD